MKIRGNKGITLIALVVTIIILIILAAVSINLVFSENGLIERAKEGSSEMQKQAAAERAKEDYVVEKAAENATMDIPEAMIDTQANQMVQEFAQRMQAQGLSMEQYFEFTGMTAEKMLEDVRPQAVKRIQTRLVLEAIAKAENIEISDEKFEEEIAKMAEMYKMEAAKLKEFMGEAEIKQMKADMAVQEAVTLVTSSAIEE